MSDELPGARHVPLGEGLVVRRVRVAEDDIVRLRGILAGYDGLASAHGDRGGRGIVALVTTEERAGELDAWLDELARELPFERI